MPTECEKKTELVIFKHQKKKVDSIKIKLICKRLFPSKSVKYLGIKINENFTGSNTFMISQ